jgi:hypothetical protein
MSESNPRHDIGQVDDGFVTLFALSATAGVGDLLCDRDERRQTEAVRLFCEDEGALRGLVELVKAMGLLHHVDLLAEIEQEAPEFLEQELVIDLCPDGLAVSGAHADHIGARALGT